MKVLVTGCAGFIGSHITDQLLDNGYSVVGIDNFNNYYNSEIKENNLKEAKRNRKFNLYREDILNFHSLKKIFQKEKPLRVIHLAARAGVRPSIENPRLYEEVNVDGTLNLLTLSVENSVEKFIFGSSSSVYGESRKLPFCENDLCDSIASVYGATKRTGEFLVESFYRSYGLDSIILRFFTVYGPRGRPDMAPALFLSAILNKKEVEIFGDGTTMRDYTYIDDICDGIVKASESKLKFEVINLGNNNPVSLKNFIRTIENITEKKAQIKRLKNQNGDVTATWANIEKAKHLLGWRPKVDLDAGLRKYVEWRNEL